MPIRVVDYYGRIYGSLQPAKAARQVHLEIAEWVHAVDIQPNPQLGTIRLLNATRTTTVEQKRTQVLDGDGVFLAWLWSPAAARIVAEHFATLIGKKSDEGHPRAILLPRVVRNEPAVLNALKHIEVNRAIDAVAARDNLRQQINHALSTCQTWAEVESRVKWLMQKCLYGPKDIQFALADLQRLSRRLKDLDLALASDTENIRAQLVQMSITS